MLNRRTTLPSASRRRFLKQSAAIGAWTAAPMFIPSRVFGANDQILTGHIGLGDKAGETCGHSVITPSRYVTSTRSIWSRPMQTPKNVVENVNCSPITVGYSIARILTRS